MASVNTIQSNIKNFDKKANITDYALMLGGLNVAHEALAQYDPLKTGYGRLFMVRKPAILTQIIPDQIRKFKHILEYGNTSISGIGDTEVNFGQMSGGYVGKSMELPTVATDNTNSFTVNVYEFSGSPIREVIHTWVNAVTDLMSGLTHYYGHLNIDKPGDKTGGYLEPCQANQTAEFIYVSTDQTGRQVEYACLLANCFPRNIKNDHFNYESGTHDMVQYGVEFSCTKYESAMINQVATNLLNKYTVLMNSIEFYPGKEIVANSNNTKDGIQYDPTSGKLVSTSADSETV